MSNTSLDNKYSSSFVEEKWYKHWIEKNYFHADSNSGLETYEKLRSGTKNKKCSASPTESAPKKLLGGPLGFWRNFRMPKGPGNLRVTSDPLE